MRQHATSEDIMGFYEQLSGYYDEIFKPGQGELDFIAERLGRPEALLDIGCGTGNKTVLFSGTAKNITAFDADKTMIELARLRHGAPNITYLTLDMRDIGTSFAPASFNAALCLGNTLVHLVNLQAMQAAIAAVCGVLKPGGIFALQILNYARILDRNITALPPLESAGVRFIRTYSRSGEFGELLDFNTELHVPGGKGPLCNSVQLYPLRPEALEAMLRAGGFGQVELYGDFGGEKLSEESFVTIALCRK